MYPYNFWLLFLTLLVIISELKCAHGRGSSRYMESCDTNMDCFETNFCSSEKKCDCVTRTHGFQQEFDLTRRMCEGLSGSKCLLTDDLQLSGGSKKWGCVPNSSCVSQPGGKSTQGLCTCNENFLSNRSGRCTLRGSLREEYESAKKHKFTKASTYGGDNKVSYFSSSGDSSLRPSNYLQRLMWVWISLLSLLITLSVNCIMASIN